MPGIPPNPVDKSQYTGLINGVPLVLEYDNATQGYKLVVAQEYAVNFMISGIVSLEAGDIEIGAVEIKDHTTDDRAHVDTSHLLHVCIASGTFLALGLIFSEYAEDSAHVSGDIGQFVLGVRHEARTSMVDADGDYAGFLFNQFGDLKVWLTGSYVISDTELPPAAVLSDDFANPTAPAVGAFNMGYYPESGTWSRLTVDANDYLEVTLGTRLSHTLDSIRIGDGTDLVGVTADGCLQTQICTGTVVADTELPAPLALADNIANPTAPAVGGYLMAYDEPNTQWVRARSSDITGNLLDSENSPAIATAAVLYARRDEPDPTTALLGLSCRAGLRRNELWVYTSGSCVFVDSELPAAAALGDAVANPTAPAVGAFGMAYNDDDAEWERIRNEGASGSFAIRTSIWGWNGSAMERVQSVDGRLQVDAELVTGSIVGLAGQTKPIERDIINITGSAGDYMLVTGTAGERVKVMEVMLITSADTEVIFKSGFTGTWLTGKLSLPSDGDGFYCGAPATPDLFHFQTESGQILVLTLVAGAQIGGWINWYDE